MCLASDVFYSHQIQSNHLNNTGHLQCYIDDRQGQRT